MCLGPTASIPCALSICSRSLFSRNTAYANRVLSAACGSANRGNSTLRHSEGLGEGSLTVFVFLFFFSGDAIGRSRTRDVDDSAFPPTFPDAPLSLSPAGNTCCRSHMYERLAPGATGYRSGTSRTEAS